MFYYTVMNDQLMLTILYIILFVYTITFCHVKTAIWFLLKTFASLDLSGIVNYSELHDVNCVT